jgi:hypothetical protein
VTEDAVGVHHVLSGGTPLQALLGKSGIGAV